MASKRVAVCGNTWFCFRCRRWIGDIGKPCGGCGHKPTRRRPTDSERLAWLLERSGLKVWSHKREWYEFPITRFQIDRLMREEASRGKK